MAWIPYLQPVGHRGVVVEDADDPVHPEAPAVALAEVPVEREEVPRDGLRDTARQDKEAVPEFRKFLYEKFENTKNKQAAASMSGPH